MFIPEFRSHLKGKIYKQMCREERGGVNVEKFLFGLEDVQLRFISEKRFQMLKTINKCTVCKRSLRV